jgi:hypothetical protein
MQELQKLWENHPDLRLGQLLVSGSNHNLGSLFYLEDDEILERLKETYERLQQ